jgi:hypothetical protein
VAEVRDHDRAADDEGDVERVVEFFVREPGLDALDEVVVDAVVAAEHGAGDEAEEFLRLAVERTVAKKRLMPRWVFSSRMRAFIRVR